MATVQLAQRIRLEENTVFYVDPAGDDANDGSSTNPWKTLQGAYDYIAWNLDLVGWNVQVLCAPASYNRGISSSIGVVGQGPNSSVKFTGAPRPVYPAAVGDAADFGAVLSHTIAIGAGSPGGGDAFSFGAGSGGGPKIFIEGFYIMSALGNGISCYGGGTGVGFDRIAWGATSGAHLKCAHGAELGAEYGAGGYEWVVGSAAYHVIAETRGRFTSDGFNSDSRNSPSFYNVNYYCADGEMNIHGMNFINPSFTSGMKFSCQANGTIQVGHVPGLMYPGQQIPGSVDGTIFTNGVVL